MTENIRRHLCFMRSARQHGVQFLVFPELSLTGYEPTLADLLAQEVDTPLIGPLRAYAREAHMTTVVGLPFRSKNHEKPLVAAFVLHADGALTVHTKQYLHTGEAHYFSAGDGGSLLQMGGIPLALSICADFSEPMHAAAAAAAGARIYAASVLIGDSGYATDSAMLKNYAQTHHMAVLMANHGGPTGGWSAAGRSIFWDEEGQVVAALSGPGNELLIVSKDGGKWQGSTAAVDTTA
jgi:predicted amidohydrolase